MTPDQKIQNIEKQITACEQGRTDAITCPYCGLMNQQEDERVCCVKFGLAAAVIIRRKEWDDKQRENERIGEIASRN